MAIKIIVDSTSSMEKEFALKNDIKIVPLKIQFSDEEYVEGFPGEYDGFYEKVENSKEFPKTSLPSPDEFSKIYQEIVSGGDQAICITISSSLSGTYNSAKLAAENFDGKIAVVDSTSCCQNIVFLAEEALELINQGKSLPEITAHLESVREKLSMKFVPQSMDYLKNGGRISLLTASIGSILKIKPILVFKNGILTSGKKVIGMSKAVNELVSGIAENTKKLYVCCIGKSHFFDSLKAKVMAKFEGIQIRLGEISPVMGAHVGPGTLGIASITY